MPNLASSSVSQICTIPTSDWTMINKRVGVVLAAAQIQSSIVAYLPSYPTLLTSCTLWQQSTFTGLITQSQALVLYATTAINNFTTLNQAVKGIDGQGGVVPDNIKQQTLSLLQKLASDTTSLAAAFDNLSKQVISFLNNNLAVDAQVEKYKDILGSFWAPVGAYITSLEQAAGLVTGEWTAITNDLQNILSTQIDVTMPFLESLNLEAAIVQWKNVQSEAAAFPNMVNGQQQYWVNPFQ